MNTETEAKFLRVDHDVIRKKLRDIGAVCEQPMRLMRRMTFDNSSMKSKNAFLRVRDEGYRMVMTYKQFDSLTVDGAKEIEIIVDDFERAIALVKSLDDNWLRMSFQESRRETWRLGNVEVVLDEWPWLDPYIEVEASSENEITDIANQLGLTMASAVYGDVMVAYRAQYPHLGEHDTVGNLPEVRFDTPLPDLFKIS